jgi:hypothetical protein
VIQVSVGQDDGMYRRRLDGKGLPVSFPEVLEPLKESAVDQNPRTPVFDEVLRTGHRPCCAEERQLSHAKILVDHLRC